MVKLFLIHLNLNIYMYICKLYNVCYAFSGIPKMWYVCDVLFELIVN